MSDFYSLATSRFIESLVMQEPQLSTHTHFKGTTPWAACGRPRFSHTHTHFKGITPWAAFGRPRFSLNLEYAPRLPSPIVHATICQCMTDCDIHPCTHTWPHSLSADLLVPESILQAAKHEAQPDQPAARTNPGHLPEGWHDLST
jgi:hypothetical protein